MSGAMFAAIVVAILVTHAPVRAHTNAAQQSPAPAAQATSETPWPPVGVFLTGRGVTRPRLIKEVKPSYTVEALRGKVQGSVWMDLVIQPDGKVGQVRVTRSLDRKFGLDEEAVTSAKQWRFTPGTKDGVPVPVLIPVEMSFTLRN